MDFWFDINTTQRNGEWHSSIWQITNLALSTERASERGIFLFCQKQTVPTNFEFHNASVYGSMRFQFENCAPIWNVQSFLRPLTDRNVLSYIECSNQTLIDFKSVWTLLWWRIQADCGIELVKLVFWMSLPWPQTHSSDVFNRFQPNPSHLK